MYKKAVAKKLANSQNSTSKSLFNSKYCEIFKSTYFEEHLRTAASENVFMKPRKNKDCSSGIFNFILRKEVKIFVFISWKKQVKMLLLISWLVSVGVFIQIAAIFLQCGNSNQWICTWVNQRKIRSSRKEDVMWTYFKFWPIKNIFQKLQANESLIMVCL